MPTYAVAVCCRHPDRPYVNNVSPFMVQAASKEEAIGKGTTVGRRLFPAEKGWHSLEAFVGLPDVVITDPNKVVLEKGNS